MDCAWKELLAVLPPWLQAEAEQTRGQFLQEIRLRADMQAVFICKEKRSASTQRATAADLQYVVNMACRYSPWTAGSVARGFLTVAGGHRIGLCGEALVRQGRMCGIARLTSMNIRVCRDFPGVSRDLWSRRGSVLLVGPPGSGKTTLLRDLIRRRAADETVAVVDERGEIFPAAAGFERGRNTDVLSGCDKRQGIETVLRLMTPQCIAVDELTADEDCKSLIRAGKCGVALLATVHADSLEDMGRRPIYRRLLQSDLFDRAVILQTDKSWRTERIVVE